MSSVFVSLNNETYAGKCKDRCENNRGGGPHAFQLNCKLAYYSEEEMNDCIEICTDACPEKYCPGGDTILCEADVKGLDKLEMEIEYYKTKLRQEYEDELMKTKGLVQAELIPLAVIFGLVVFLAIVLSMWAYRKKKKLAAARAQMQQNEPLQTTKPIQPHHHPAIGQQSVKVVGRVDSAGRVFTVNNN